MQHKIQSAFMNSVYQETDSLEPYIAEFGSLTKKERVEIYRNSAFVNLKTVLSELFPAIVTLVGIEFFRYLTHEFIQSTPPQKGSLMYYGVEFGPFLKTFNAVTDYPYLSDVAAIEWACHESYDAIDEHVLTVEDFQGLTEHSLENLTLTLNESVKLLAFKTPAYTLWQATKNNDSVPENINLNQKEYLLIYRDKNLDVQQKILSEGSYTFYKALENKKTFVQASENATLHQHDIQADIVLALHEGLFKKKEKENV